MDQPKNPSRIVQNVSQVTIVTERDWPHPWIARQDHSVSVEALSPHPVLSAPTATLPTCVGVRTARPALGATTVMELEERLQQMSVTQDFIVEKKPTPRPHQTVSREDCVLQEGTAQRVQPHPLLVLSGSTVKVQGPRPSLTVFRAILDFTVLGQVAQQPPLSVLLAFIVQGDQEFPHSIQHLLDTTQRKEPSNLNPVQLVSSSWPRSPPNVTSAVKGTTVMELVPSIRFFVPGATTALRVAAILHPVLEEHS